MRRGLTCGGAHKAAPTTKYHVFGALSPSTDDRTTSIHVLPYAAAGAALTYHASSRPFLSCVLSGVLQIHEGGSFAEVEFAAMGSGSLAALSVLEVRLTLLL